MEQPSPAKSLPSNRAEHIPVLLKEILEWLDPKPGEWFVDATANGGGHLLALAERIAPGGKILGIEYDPDVYKQLSMTVSKSSYQNAIRIINGNYANLSRILADMKWESPAGILFDFGISSLQLEKSGRGFSFQKDEPLDMRFNPSASTCRASDIVNHATKEELETILRNYGEERYAKKIAERITEERKHHAITRTGELVRVIERAFPHRAKQGRIHYATRTFQALRIAVNREFETIEQGLRVALGALSPKGKIAVISFHSLEDRIVKTLFKEKAGERVLSLITKKPITPTIEEIRKNPRARSAKLRIAERI